MHYKNQCLEVNLISFFNPAKLTGSPLGTVWDWGETGLLWIVATLYPFLDAVATWCPLDYHLLPFEGSPLVSPMRAGIPK